MPPKLTIWNKRMLELMDYCIDNKIVKNKRSFFDSIGFTETGLRKIKTGTQSFTVEQIVKASAKYNINLNWMAGLENNMMRKAGSEKQDAMKRLKEIIKEIEVAYRK